MIKVYTDGSCKGNGKNDAYGAIGFVIVKDDKIIFEHTRTYLGTTNNRMEYLSLITAMKTCIHNNLFDVTFVLDSQLLLKTVTEWMEGWRTKGWQKSGKSSNDRTIKNLDLVIKLWELKKELPHARYEWVKGHSGHIFNDRADELTGMIDKEHALLDEIDRDIINKYGILNYFDGV